MNHQRTPGRRRCSAPPVMRGIAAGMAAAIATGAASADTRAAVTMLIARAAEKNHAFINGDMAHWIGLVRIAPDFTLMQPFGGPASHGFDASPEHLAELARSFRRGEASLEVAASYGTEDMIVLVMTERQQAEIGELPRQDWSLRVTEVYRRDGNGWQLVHRHADPLTRPLTLRQAAAIARGDAFGAPGQDGGEDGGSDR